MRSIELNQEISYKMIAHARSSYPEECCGFLFGSEDQNGNRSITDILIVDNVKSENRKRRFEIDPLDYIKAEKKASESGLKLLSIYHTHPDHPARPSEHDRKQAVPYFSYIIMSVTMDQVIDVTSWQLNTNDVFDQEQIKLEKIQKENI